MLELERFGCDPEIFVQYADGTIGCPSELLPEPKIIKQISNSSGGVNRDGLAFELNPTPSSDPKEVAGHIFQLMADGGKILAEMGLNFAQEFYADIQMAKCSKMDYGMLPPDVYQLGCEPDWNAYTGRHNSIRVNPRFYTKRFAGGHITVQLPTKLSFREIRELVKLFDISAGLHSIRWSRKGSIERRKTYGRAGAFRYHPDKRILEYRTPDVGWLWNDGYVEMCELMKASFKDFQRGLRLRNCSTMKLAINSCDKQLAKELAR